MAMPYVEKSFETPSQILMFPDGYECFAQTFTSSDANVTTVDSRSVIKAGTVWPSNDGSAKGVVFTDVDVTDGDASGAVLFAGSVRVSAMPAEPASAAKTALPKITFFAKA